MTKEMNEDDLKAMIENLKKENQKLKAPASRSGKLSIKFGAQPGVISVYGLGQFPVSQYSETWRKLLDSKDDILAFIDKAEADGLMPNEEEIAAGKAAAKLRREEARALKAAQSD